MPNTKARTVTAPARTAGGRFARVTVDKVTTVVKLSTVDNVEIALPADLEQRRMVDEFGELDRRMQMLKPDITRHELLKRAIKSWFDRAPADADGLVEGEVYRLHVSARERERRIRDMHLLVETVGLEKVLELANVPLGAVEDLVGRKRVDELTIEGRTGSRRIKAVPKYAVVKKG